MTDDQSGRHADIELLVGAELLGDEFARGLRDGLQALDEERGDAGDEFHHGAHLDAQTQSGGNVVHHSLPALAGQTADDDADEHTQEERFAEEAELLLHALRVDVHLVDAGHVVEHLVDGDGKRHEALTEGLGDADALHAGIEFLEAFGAHVGQHEGDDVAHDGGEEAPHDAAGHEVDDGADEGEVPVVPQVDVHRARAAQQEQHEVHAQADGNDERAHQRVVGHGGGCGPAHVEHLQLEAVDFDHFTQCGAERRGQQGRHNGEAHEADAHAQAAAEGFGEIDADAYAQDGEDDGHHHGRTETDDVGKDCFHGVMCLCFVFLVYFSSKEVLPMLWPSAKMSARYCPAGSVSAMSQ